MPPCRRCHHGATAPAAPRLPSSDRISSPSRSRTLSINFFFPRAAGRPPRTGADRTGCARLCAFRCNQCPGLFRRGRLPRLHYVSGAVIRPLSVWAPRMQRPAATVPAEPPKYRGSYRPLSAQPRSRRDPRRVPSIAVPCCQHWPILQVAVEVPGVATRWRRGDDSSRTLGRCCERRV